MSETTLKTSEPTNLAKFTLKSLLNSDTTQGRFFDIFIQILICLSILTFSIETIPDLPEYIITTLGVIESFIVIVFTFEYFLQIYFNEKKLKYILSFGGIVDVIAIAPFYISFFIASGIDLRYIRMLRLVRIFKIFKHNKSVDRFRIAFQEIKNDLIFFSIVTMFVLFGSAILMYICEHDAQPEAFASVFHSLWWAIVTLTTVGYGDVYPVTMGGRIVTFILLMIGLAIISIPAGLLAAALSKKQD